ncbi:slit homolog 3 protein-like [Stegodyphus dumicola]|uniref:slit homolog 3 protein-like n=1 Tax=Stegodyphus dumicola TaxID=202533 RepID=UPI0015ACE9D0|nr:slit homolog 3 protein-like [Stegodyphus dumicola]
MENLKKLKTLDLEGNYIAVVNNHWFERGPTSLRKLRFVKGQISIVGYKAFEVLKNLEMLDLSDNSITYLARSALPQPALLLQEINLERNKLESLPENIFHRMPNLKRVNLELNEFSTFDESIWRPVWCHLEILNIDYNPMICDSKIRWLYHGAKSLATKLIGTCYKPFKLMDRDLHSLTVNELQ